MGPWGTARPRGREHVASACSRVRNGEKGTAPASGSRRRRPLVPRARRRHRDRARRGRRGAERPSGAGRRLLRGRAVPQRIAARPDEPRCGRRHRRRDRGERRRDAGDELDEPRPRCARPADRRAARRPAAAGGLRERGRRGAVRPRRHRRVVARRLWPHLGRGRDRNGSDPRAGRRARPADLRPVRSARQRVHRRRRRPGPAARRSATTRSPRPASWSTAPWWRRSPPR